MRKYVTVALVASLLFTCFTVFLSFDTCRAVGNIIYVNASGGANYTTMQEAVDAAEPGDEIFVYNGEYHENVVITKNLILTGQSKDDTTINGDKNDHHVVYANGSDGKEIEFQISGFTIKNAGGTGKDCIALSYVDSGEINDNKIMNSDSDGIQLDHCSGVTISENTITDNEQCGIYLISSTDNIIRDNDQIQNNPIGIRLYLSSNNILYKNDLSSNGQNAQDSGTNSWSYNQQGNYWDDYSGEDSDEDGKGDTPYDIPGGTNQDLYPLGYFTQQPPANQKPVAYIDQPSDQSIATYGQTVSFTGHWTDSDGTVVGYNWRSNIDGQLSTSASFSTSGLSLGQHTIYLKVRDDDGEWSNEKYITITITQNQKPTANILNPTKSTYVYGETILFSGSGTDPDGEIVGYSWRSVPSGLVSSQNSFTLSNLPIDEYTIYFKVRDDYGDWSQEASRTLIVISDPSIPNEPPNANSGGPYSGGVNEEITFSGAGSNDPDVGDSLTYNWNFGDNATGEGVSPKHTYSVDGNYTIELTVVDSHGEQSKSTTYANITTKSSGQNQNGDDSSDKIIPGFELIVLIIAIGIILLLKQNKKRGYN